MALNHIRLPLGAVLLAIMLPAAAQDSVPAPAFTAAGQGQGPDPDAAAASQLVADMDNATTIWDNACADCHGELGQGGQGGVPDIRNSPFSLGQIMGVVKAGSNTMPAFAGFTPQELLDISTYVLNEL